MAVHPGKRSADKLRLQARPASLGDKISVFAADYPH